jgi:hypothetical protein
MNSEIGDIRPEAGDEAETGDKVVPHCSLCGLAVLAAAIAAWALIVGAARLILL